MPRRIQRDSSRVLRFIVSVDDSLPEVPLPRQRLDLGAQTSRADPAWPVACFLLLLTGAPVQYGELGPLRLDVL
jgi:hypothetical protein